MPGRIHRLVYSSNPRLDAARLVHFITNPDKSLADYKYASERKTHIHVGPVHPFSHTHTPTHMKKNPERRDDNINHTIHYPEHTMYTMYWLLLPPRVMSKYFLHTKTIALTARHTYNNRAVCDNNLGAEKRVFDMPQPARPFVCVCLCPFRVASI